MKTSLKFFSGVFVAVFLSAGCVGAPPIREYNLTATAMNAAKAAGAPRLANGYYTKAEDHYRLAQQQFADREYDKAKVNFRQAKLFAERAENLSVLKKASSGEGGE